MAKQWQLYTEYVVLQMSNKTNVGSRGFTILELLIAMGVFSFVLLLVTVVIIGIGNLYSKGINQSKTQDAVRYIADDVSQHLQYSSGFTTGVDVYAIDPNNKTESYCVAGTRYSYVIGKKTGDLIRGATIKHIVWRDDFNGACTPADLTSQTPTPSGKELVPANTQLTKFSISPSVSPYTISVGLGYGSPENYTNLNNGDIQCAGSATQYCATSELTTIAVKRL